MKTMIWEGHTADFKALQESLRAGIDLEPLQDQPRLIAGADISLNRGSRTVYAGIVVLDYQTLEMVCYFPNSDRRNRPFSAKLSSYSNFSPRC